MRKKIKMVATVIDMFIIFIVVYLVYLNVTLPNYYNIIKGGNIDINGNKSISLELREQYKINGEIETSSFNFCTEEMQNNQDKKQEGFDEYNINNFETFVKAYNIFPIKQVSVHEMDQIEVYPCGRAFGIKMFTKGVMVVGMGEVDKGIIPSKDAGIKLGDIILSIDSIPVYNNEDIANIVNNSNGRELIIKIIRNDEEHTFKLMPKKSPYEDNYKAGMWVRNSTAGIGTLTFCTEDGFFCGLGHPVCDVDTGQIMPLLTGEIIGVKIDDINKGTIGVPGELKGVFSDLENIGLLTRNTNSGVYGKIIDFEYLNRCDKIPVAMRQDIKQGPAKILTTVDGEEPQFFNISIEKINYNHINPCKNMVIKIIDKDLIEKTGGIVQGMSGSPIIQNGKLVGAITHVFVNQPLKGYGIFAENMIENLQALS